MIACMSPSNKPFLVFADPDDYDRVRGVLTRAGYNAPGILEALGLVGESIPSTGHPMLLRNTQGGRPIDTLIRLFIAGASVDEGAAVEALAPMTVEQWRSAGLLHVEQGMVSSLVKMLPVDQFYIVHDMHRPGT